MLLFHWLILKMKILFLIIAFLLPISCFCQIWEEYQGGRHGYSSVRLTLNSDSTYQYYEWFHTRASRRDTGRWEKKEKYLILTSTVQSFWQSPTVQQKKIKKEYLFKNDKFQLEDTILKMYSEKRKDSFNVLYYTLRKKE